MTVTKGPGLMGMCRIVILLASVCAALAACAGPAESPRYVDLRDEQALEALRRDNPKHYAQIQTILTALLEEPKRVETGWLQATFDARDVTLDSLAFRTSDPPKQSLQFTLDDTRYTMDLVRTDLGAAYTPAN